MDKLKHYYKVGRIKRYISDLVDFKYFGQVYAFPGVIKHIKKRHKNQLNNNFLNNIIPTIKEIIKSPDYIGIHPQKKSIELVKKFKINLMIGIEVDLQNKYMYVATMYPLHESKIKNRLNSGRLIEYHKSKK